MKTDLIQKAIVRAGFSNAKVTELHQLDLIQVMYHLIDVANEQCNIDDVSESVTCFNCNGWGYTLLPNGKRDKHCTVCDGSNVR